MKRWISGLLLFATYLNILMIPASSVRAQNIRNARESKMKDKPSGLSFRLSGARQAEQAQQHGVAESVPISADQTSQILGRLPALVPKTDDRSDFAKRLGTLPPPKTGDRVAVKFPASGQGANPPGTNGTELSVVRYSPEGEVKLAPDLSVTFSEPMVAVTSQEKAAEYAPVELSPMVEGRWRWLGTRTLMFDTDKRFPMATKFTARIPAGTRSAMGKMLAKDISWTFTTPPPSVERVAPENQIVKREVIMAASFDQKIDPAAVLPHVNITAGGKRIPIRLATDEETASNNSVLQVTQSYKPEPGRWIAFRSIDPLPYDSQIRVTFERGVPSAEGPLTSIEAKSFSFKTYGALKFIGAYCGWDQNRKTCRPDEDFRLQFNNDLYPIALDEAFVKIEPKIEGAKVYASGPYIYIQGYKKGNTQYSITVDAKLKDIYNQTLERGVAAKLMVGRADPVLYAQGGPMSVLDPSAKPAYSVYSVNNSTVKVRLYKVEPENWSQFQQYYRRLNYDDGKRPAIPGTLVFDKIVQISNKPDELVETRIDISQGLNSGGFGNVIIDVSPVEESKKAANVYARNPRIFAWLQATKIGLDAFVDNSELVGFATELATGKPLAGVELSIYPHGSAISQVLPGEEEKGVIESAWDWLTGTGGPSDDEIESFDQDGGEVLSEPISGSQTNRTGTQGVLRIPLPDATSSAGPNMLIAHRGGDTAFLPENSEYYWNDSGSWYKKPAYDSLRWFVFTDRNMYRPKEEVSVKGYIRRITGGKLGDVEGLGDSASGLNWSVKDPQNNEIAKGTGSLNAFGAFDLKFKLPDNANLGYSRIDLSTNSSVAGASFSEQFQIQEFRRPEFEVIATVDSEAPHIVGGSANLTVDAKYYAGGGLANAATNWTVTATPTNYTPPNRSDFTFGTWVPWWRGFDDDYSRGYGGITQTFSGVTDASGKHHLKIDFDSVNPPQPYTISANAAVQDVNRQTWAGNARLLVHPAELYVGIRTPRTFVQKGEKIDVESIVSDIDGKLIAGRDIEIRAELKDWVFDNGSWKEATVDEQTCSVKSEPPASAGGEYSRAAKCSFIAKAGGRYMISATIMDDRERFNESQITIWVPGGKMPPNRSVEQEDVQIIPSKKEYSPGDVAEVLVIAPFSPAEGILTLRREGIVKAERFTIKDSSVTLKIPLDEEFLPNINVQVDIVGAAERSGDTLVSIGGSSAESSTERRSGVRGNKSVPVPRPAFASGNIDLSISTASRKLSVNAEPRDKTLAPGGETMVDIEVKDSTGEPVADSEVAVVIVDESVLALTGYNIADPMSIFYTPRGSGVADYHLRKDVLLGNPDDVNGTPPPPPPAPEMINSASASIAGVAYEGRPAMKAMARQAKDEGLSVDHFGGGKSPDQSAIDLRQNFNALAVFLPSGRTDRNGQTTVDVKLPDNLTRYRITAVSVDRGKRFGKSESSITAKQPLMVRPSAPRFMNFGDKIELPVVVQNQTDKDLAVDVAIRATNARLAEPGAIVSGQQETSTDAKAPGVETAGKRVIVKANDRAEIRFPVAADKAGTARFQFAATSGNFSDAAEISLPVWTPATTEAFATYGTTDANGAIRQPIEAPADVFPQFGGLEVTTSSTQLQELTDAYLYLASYPFECSEQIASRMISTAALRDVLAAFKAKEMPSPKDVEAKFASDMQILRSRQRADGSFGLWQHERERYEYPFLTVHVAHALALAKIKGYKVPENMLALTKPYLKNVESHFDDWHKRSPQARWTVSAYALYVRDLMGDKDTAKAKKLLAEAAGEGNAATPKFDKVPFEALGWILNVLADDKDSNAEVESIVRFLLNRTTETAASANFVTDYGDGGWLVMYSNRRADGVLLESLIKVRGAGFGQPNAEPSAVQTAANDLIPKLVRGLLDHRNKGRWSSTQENVFILLALDKYFNAFEKVTPNFVARIWLGNAYAGEQVFKGRSIDSNQLDIPMPYLIDQGGSPDLIFDKQGGGRLYYRIGMKYAPRSLKLDPADYGFTVLRRYEAIDNAADVKQNADGTWTIKSGARVRVRLTMVAQARRYHVALVDNLPAGLEILNPGLAVTEAIPADVNAGNTGVAQFNSRSFGGSWWWRQYWFEHQNFRDERAEAFASLLWEGVYSYTYVTRATTPGHFIVPPAKAEEMYHPETFGRTGTDIVTVE